MNQVTDPNGNPQIELLDYQGDGVVVTRQGSQQDGYALDLQVRFDGVSNEDGTIHNYQVGVTPTVALGDLLRGLGLNILDCAVALGMQANTDPNALRLILGDPNDMHVQLIRDREAGFVDVLAKDAAGNEMACMLPVADFLEALGFKPREESKLLLPGSSRMQ